MRKKGENNSKYPGKSCDSARQNNDFTVGVESQRPFGDTRSLFDIEFGTELH
jgi:hypothetical protein